eukprot:3394319-Amphidinium_carterae.1
MNVWAETFHELEFTLIDHMQNEVNRVCENSQYYEVQGYGAINRAIGTLLRHGHMGRAGRLRHGEDDVLDFQGVSTTKTGSKSEPS